MTYQPLTNDLDTRLQLIDTHCHIHDKEFFTPEAAEAAYERAAENGVTKMICVGTSETSSRDAATFAEEHEGVYASIGVHPHDTKDGYDAIAGLASNNILAVGEIGLDYFYDHSSREVQIEALESQIQTAIDHDLPIIFHVREAFTDFWPIFDNFHGIRGVLHSFTDTQDNLDEGFQRGLYVGVNGISTFTKDVAQQELYAHIPLEKMLLETDAPFLTPAPYRGTINEPAYVSRVAQHHALLRGIEPHIVAKATTQNAQTLFDFK